MTEEQKKEYDFLKQNYTDLIKMTCTLKEKMDALTNEDHLNKLYQYVDKYYFNEYSNQGEYSGAYYYVKSVNSTLIFLETVYLEIQNTDSFLLNTNYHVKSLEFLGKQITKEQFMDAWKTFTNNFI